MENVQEEPPKYGQAWVFESLTPQLKRAEFISLYNDMPAYRKWADKHDVARKMFDTQRADDEESLPGDRTAAISYQLAYPIDKFASSPQFDPLNGRNSLIYVFEGGDRGSVRLIVRKLSTVWVDAPFAQPEVTDYIIGVAFEGDARIPDRRPRLAVENLFRKLTSKPGQRSRIMQTNNDAVETRVMGSEDPERRSEKRLAIVASGMVAALADLIQREDFHIAEGSAQESGVNVRSDMALPMLDQDRLADMTSMAAIPSKTSVCLDKAALRYIQKNLSDTQLQRLATLSPSFGRFLGRRKRKGERVPLPADREAKKWIARASMARGAWLMRVNEFVSPLSLAHKNDANSVVTVSLGQRGLRVAYYGRGDAVDDLGALFRGDFRLNLESGVIDLDPQRFDAGEVQGLLDRQDSPPSMMLFFSQVGSTLPRQFDAQKRYTFVEITEKDKDNKRAFEAAITIPLEAFGANEMPRIAQALEEVTASMLESVFALGFRNAKKKK